MTFTEIDVPGGRLAVRVEGSGSPVVLVHAGIADHRMWDAVVPALTRRHTVVRYDLRGFGASTAPTALFRHTDDLHGLLDTLDLGRVPLVGASFGGKVALEFTAAHPGRVSALAVLAPPLPGHGWSPSVLAYAEAEEAALEADDLDTAVRLNLDMWVRGPARGWDEAPVGLADRIREPLRVSLLNQAAGDEYESEPGQPVRDVLGEIGVPTLIGIGDQDVADFAAISEHLAGAIPGARLIRFTGTGHLIAAERPKETADVLLGFLARDFPARPGAPE